MSQAASTHLPPAPLPLRPEPAAPWQLGWLRPPICHLLLILLLLFQILPRIQYLHSPEAVELAPDEAQYWVWSRHLDWSYYSKGPMVALFIRASTVIFGDSMPAVRYPAMLIGVLMTVLTYLLTRRLFGSWKTALGAVGLNYVVPMFMAGSMLMTIDPPFVLFWSAATALFCLAIFENRKWAWPLAGLMVGCSFLAKYASFVLFAGVLLGLLADRDVRRQVLSPWPWLALVVAAACTTPVIYWNAIHGWVSAHHVNADVTSGFNPMEPVAFLSGTFVLIGPALGIILAAAGWAALRWGGNARLAAENHTTPDHARRARFLVLTVLPYLLMVVASSFFTNAQLNWTAPVWFAALIVGAYFLSTRLATAATWRPWRGWLYGTIVFALVLMPFAHNVPALYPTYAWVQTRLLGRTVRTAEYEVTRPTLTREQQKKEISVRVWDPTARLRGWQQLADDLDERRKRLLGEDAFFMLDDYSEAAALEFYVPGHPTTYVMGAFIEDPKHRGRSSQWDIWPERSLERGKTDPRLLGKNAIYIGSGWKALSKSFDRVEQLPVHSIIYPYKGVNYYLGGYRVFACYGFRGFVRPTDGVTEW